MNERKVKKVECALTSCVSSVFDYHNCTNWFVKQQVQSHVAINLSKFDLDLRLLDT